MTTIKLEAQQGGGSGSDITKEYVDSEVANAITVSEAYARDISSGKVDKQAGKVLSSNDYTDADKTKLYGIEAGAQKNLEGTVVDTAYVHTDSNFTAAEKTKLSGIEIGAQKNLLNTVVDANYVHTDNNYTTADRNYIAGLPVALAGKQDTLVAGTGIKIEGNEISNTSTDAEWGKINGSLSSQEDLQGALNSKVDKVAGKGLSTNDYTAADKNKLTGIESGAQKNLEGTVVDANYTHTDNNYTNEDKNKLAGIATGANKNVQVDWNQTDPTADDFLKNKPVIPEGSVLYQAFGQNTDGGISQKVITDKIGTIIDLFPEQATVDNQLADKEFVNSTVGTNTAYYISNNGEPFNSLAELEAYSGTVTNNDYAFVKGTDTTGNTTYTRYKYNSETATWAEEYVLNNSSFTAVQWSAINSGVTTEEVTKLAGIESGAQKNAVNTVVDANYVHTDNNYTNEDKTKLAGIESGAEKNLENTVTDAFYVHTDMNYTASDKAKLMGIEAGAQKNLDNTVVDASYVHTDNNYTNDEKDKLEGIESGAQKNAAGTVVDSSYVHTDNNYTNADKIKLTNIEAGAQVNAANTVIDASYVHTDNNYTTTEKNKLAGVEAGAEKNLPNTVTDADYVHTDSNFTLEEKRQLSTIEYHAQKNVQSDWNQTNTTADDYIKNKPNNNYSTSEINTNTTWIDGKTIYKKTVYFGALPNNTLKSVSHDITGLSKVIKFEGIAYTGDVAITLPLVYKGSDSAYNVEIQVTSTVIRMSASQDRSSYDAYVTIYYTKES